MNSPSSRSSRRAFLTGRAAAATSGDRTVPTGLPAALPDLVGRPYLVHFSRRAMACEFEVCFNAGQYPQGPQAAIKALDLIEQLEDKMTVFRPTSQLMTVNREAATRPVEVDEELYQLLELAARLYSQTDGAYDVTTGPLTKVWGFHQRAGRVPDAESLRDALRAVGFDHVRLDPERRTVRFTRHGVELNLGSIGKGFALDRAAEFLEAAGVHDFIWHGGQSSVLARGNTALRSSPKAASSEQPSTSHGEFTTAANDDRPSPSDTESPASAPHDKSDRTATSANAKAPRDTRADLSGIQEPTAEEGWWVGVRDPLRPKRRLARLCLRNQALATSGSRVQFFRHQGRRYGHILDPRTGHPVEGVLSVTTVAPTAALADALATAFYVMGPKAAAHYAQRHPEVGALFVTRSRPGERGPLQTTTVNLDADCLRWEPAPSTEEPPE